MVKENSGLNFMIRNLNLLNDLIKLGDNMVDQSSSSSSSS